MTDVVILGGGTAGWLTALVVQRMYPEYNISLVESEEIGILGAGEGTVPDFVALIQFLGLNKNDIIKHCDGSLKLGINFENWNGDGKSYFHAFANNDFGDDKEIEQSLYYHFLARGQKVQDFLLPLKLAESGKSPFTVGQNQLLEHSCAYAVHFNARKLATYLRSIAEARGILRIEGKMIAVHEKENHDIDWLELDDGTQVIGDFFFDCSGFARLLIGKHYNVEWTSYNDRLPLDTALPFFIPHDNKNIKPQTDAIAMKYGWVWKIPVKDRYGCGYVFDSKYISSEEAIAEAEEYFGMKLESPKTFKFKAGSYKETVKNNCMAVGLAQSFIEPLEATSIWVSVLNLQSFLLHGMINKRTEQGVRLFNESATHRNETVVDFIYLHYITKRNDSPFWREFAEKNQIPEHLKERIQHWNEYGIMWDRDLYSISRSQHGKFFLFNTESWIQVANGLDILDTSVYKRIADTRPITAEQENQLSAIQRSLYDRCVPHDQFMDFCRSM
jgi:tryptophan 7-halogenase